MNGADRENKSGKRIRFPALDGLKFKNERGNRGRDIDAFVRPRGVTASAVKRDPKKSVAAVEGPLRREIFPEGTEEAT